jgi:hypothetical protein
MKRNKNAAERTGKVPVNPDHWSRSSRRSAIFWNPPAHYTDVHYRCARCGVSALFTATDQKEAFEGRKAYVWQRRKLCQGCWNARRQIEREIRIFQARWRANKRELERDKGFLGQWLELLERHPEYDGRTNHAGIRMLQRLLLIAAYCSGT